MKAKLAQRDRAARTEFEDGRRCLGRTAKVTMMIMMIISESFGQV